MSTTSAPAFFVQGQVTFPNFLCSQVCQVPQVSFHAQHHHPGQDQDISAHSSRLPNPAGLPVEERSVSQLTVHVTGPDEGAAARSTCLCGGWTRDRKLSC